MPWIESGANFGKVRSAAKADQTQDASIAVIPIEGALVSGSVPEAFWGWAMGYDDIVGLVRAAAAQYDGIVLKLDSPGGSAQGMVETAAQLREIAEQSGVSLVAFGGFVLSAAYGIAVAADMIIAPRSAWTGMVGSVMATIRPEGLKLGEAWPGMTSVISAYPKEKAPMASHLYPADDELQAQFDRLVKASGDDFIKLVASSRGLAEQDVLAWKAQIFHGAEAVKAKAIDGIGTLEQAIAEAKKRSKKRGKKMGANALTTERGTAALASVLGIGAEDKKTIDEIEAAAAKAKASIEFAEAAQSILGASGADGIERLKVAVSAQAALADAREQLKGREVQLAVSSGLMTPGEAYGTGEARAYPVMPDVAAELKAMSLEAVRARIETRAPSAATMKPPSPRPISTVSMGVTDELAQKYGFKNAAEYEEFLAKHNGAA
jgi:ClpP class serine protease